MRKIKSVKLKNDYRTAYYFLKKGSLLRFDKNEKDWISDLGHNYSENEIRDCKTDLFEIEYEEERKYIDVRIEYEYDSSNSSLPLTANNLETHFDIATELKNAKVTELSEQFSRDDLIDFYRWKNRKGQVIGDMISAWLLERKSK